MAKSEQKDRLVDKLRSKYRLIIINDNTFEERFSMKLSRLNVIAVMAVAGFLIALLTLAIIVYTPARALIPGYSDQEARIQARTALDKADKLEAELLTTQVYLDNVRMVLNGEMRPDQIPYDSIQALGSDAGAQLDFTVSERDSALRASVAAEEKYNLKFDSNSGEERLGDLSTVLFFSPIRGKVSSSYSIGADHLGTDIVAPDDEPIKACLDGTVTFSTWTSTEGYVIMIQHSNDLLSVYKHNSVLLKKLGENVKAGDSIAIIGNTGELTDGPHLHFELWHKGVALDPEKYLVFN